MPDGWSGAILTNGEAEDGLIPMGITSENVAAEFGILRKRKGKFAARSFRKAAAAQKAGIFEDEFVSLGSKPPTRRSRKRQNLWWMQMMGYVTP